MKLRLAFQVAQELEYLVLIVFCRTRIEYYYEDHLYG